MTDDFGDLMEIREHAVVPPRDAILILGDSSRLRIQRLVAMDPAHVVVAVDRDMVLVDATTGRRTVLGADPDRTETAAFSARGDEVAFTRTVASRHSVVVRRLDSGCERGFDLGAAAAKDLIFDDKTGVFAFNSVTPTWRRSGTCRFRFRVRGRRFFTNDEWRTIAPDGPPPPIIDEQTPFTSVIEPQLGVGPLRWVSPTPG
jgi:hypothetical protein